jgi:hypothetical protein
MDGTRSGEPLTDSVLDRELESALDIEPSPEFLARVRTRVAAEPEASYWRLASWGTGWGRGMQPMVAMAVVAVTLAVIVPRWMRDDEIPSKRLVAAMTETAPIAPASPGVQSAQPVERPATRLPVRAARPTAASNEVPLRLSQPLFSDGERRAFFNIAIAVEEGRVPPVPALPEAVDQSLTVRELSIEPLVIDPLPLLARVQAEGEGQW